MTDAGKGTGSPWSLLFSEVTGTAHLVLGGLTCVSRSGRSAGRPSTPPSRSRSGWPARPSRRSPWPLSRASSSPTGLSGPSLLGTFLAMLVCSRLAKRIEAARLYHFETANDRLARRAT
jgi:hypothetical protein